MTFKPKPDDAPLNDRQEAFCQSYARYGNATRAAKEAGYSEKTAHVQGHRLLNDAKILTRIEIAKADRFKALHMTADETLALIAKRSRFNLKGLIKIEGGVPVVDLESATDEQLECLSEASMSAEGVLKVKGPNVDASLTTMARIQGLLKDKVELSVDSDFAAKMAAAMQRARPAEGDGNDG